MIYLQIIIALVLNALALMATAYIVPGFHVADFKSAVLASVVLGVVNTFIKPILKFITLPITLITLGLFSFVINALVLFMVSAVVPGLKLDSWIAAILGSIVLSIVGTVLSKLVSVT